MKKILHVMMLITGFAALVWTGCESIEIKKVECGGDAGESDTGDTEDTDSTDAGDSIDAGAADGGDTDTGTDTDTDTGAPGSVGAACEGDDDCLGDMNLCLNSEFLSGLGLELDVPGGSCSMLSCFEHSECGPGGFCLNTEPFSGMPITLCMRDCTSDSGCREGYECFTEETAGSACLAREIVISIECGDGACSDREQADPERCPEDNC